MAANSLPARSSRGQGFWSSLSPLLLLYPPTVTLFRRNHFQAVLLCSQHCSSALCVLGGRELSRPGTVTSTTVRSPFWKGYFVRDTQFSVRLECVITLLCLTCMQCPLQRQASFCCLTTGGGQPCFFVLNVCSSEAI